MFLRLAHLFMFLAVFQLMGVHWVVLQSVAWAKMLVEYSQESSISTAIEDTFSGERPCSMCHKVAEGKKKEETRSTPLADAKLLKKSELFVTTAILNHPCLISESIIWDEFSLVYNGCSNAPSTPPPNLS